MTTRKIGNYLYSTDSNKRVYRSIITRISECKQFIDVMSDIATWTIGESDIDADFETKRNIFSTPDRAFDYVNYLNANEIGKVLNVNDLVFYWHDTKQEVVCHKIISIENGVLTIDYHDQKMTIEDIIRKDNQFANYDDA